VLKGDGSVIDEGLLSSRIRQPAPGLELGPDDPATLPQAVENLERAMIYRVLSRNEWNKTRAAAELRISRRNLIRKVQKYGLEKQKYGLEKHR